VNENGLASIKLKITIIVAVDFTAFENYDFRNIIVVDKLGPTTTICVSGLCAFDGFETWR